MYSAHRTRQDILICHINTESEIWMKTHGEASGLCLVQQNGKNNNEYFDEESRMRHSIYVTYVYAYIKYFLHLMQVY